MKGLWNKPLRDGIIFIVVVKDVHYTTIVAFQCMNVGLGYGNHVRNDEGNDQRAYMVYWHSISFSKKHGYSHDKDVTMSVKLSAIMLSTSQKKQLKFSTIAMDNHMQRSRTLGVWGQKSYNVT
jgi:hypothetical protein